MTNIQVYYEHAADHSGHKQECIHFFWYQRVTKAKVTVPVSSNTEYSISLSISLYSYHHNTIVISVTSFDE